MNVLSKDSQEISLNSWKNQENPFTKLKIGKVFIDVVTFEQAVDYILSLTNQPFPQMIVTPNVDHIVMLEHNEELYKAYQKAALVVADGMPLVWLSRLLEPKLPERVCGADLLPALAEKAAEQKKTLYFLGAPPGVAEKAAKILSERYKGLKIVGTYAPPLGFEHKEHECEFIIESIIRQNPDLIFVALGAPKQELWIARNLHRFPRGVFLGVGAAIGFVAGHETRAPKTWQNLGLEWLYRMLQNPRRMLPRYTRDLAFLGIAAQTWWQFHRNNKHNTYNSSKR